MHDQGGILKHFSTGPPISQFRDTLITEIGAGLGATLFNSGIMSNKTDRESSQPDLHVAIERSDPPKWSPAFRSFQEGVHKSYRWNRSAGWPSKQRASEPLNEYWIGC